MRNLLPFLFTFWVVFQIAEPALGEAKIVAATGEIVALPSRDTPQEKPAAKVSFTFDCAQWGDAGLNHILEVMKRRKITGTFFVTGKFIETNREGILKIIEAGHEVANHSYEHDKKNSIEECNRVARLYEEATGQKMAEFFRAPYLHEKHINWSHYAKNGWEEGYVSLITCDALPEYKLISDGLFLKNFSIYVARGSSERIAIDKPFSKSAPGHINGAAILMHIDGYRFHLLENMIDIVQRSGYTCTTFSEASLSRKLGDPFPGSKNREMIPLDLTGLAQHARNDTALTLAKVADPRPDFEKMNAAQKVLLKNAINPSRTKRGEISFTFDCDDYNPTGLGSILIALEKTKVQSTFYITENYLNEYPGAVKAILEHGHEIANGGTSQEKTTTPEDAESFATSFKEKTGVELIRLFRSADVEFDWNPYANRGWGNGYVSLDTCDQEEGARAVGDGSFIAYFKIYAAVAPREQVSILKVPYTGTGNMDGRVIAMSPNGFRYHLLEKMISHAREKGYTPVAQSKLKSLRL